MSEYFTLIVDFVLNGLTDQQVDLFIQQQGLNLRALRNARGQTLIHAGASRNNLRLIDLGLRYNVDIDTVDVWDECALTLSVRTRDINMMNELLARGACLEIYDDRDDSALTWAAFYGQLDMVQRLVYFGADVYHEYNQPYLTAWEWAARRGHLDVFLWLWPWFADSIEMYISGYTRVVRQGGAVVKSPKESIFTIADDIIVGYLNRWIQFRSTIIRNTIQTNYSNHPLFDSNIIGTCSNLPTATILGFYSSIG
jgi:ankyrin repeat protein